ncbi:small subunit of acetolactate synthase-domain-containing protein [Entophlyctis helioformis]|nr:small subunit of acetolactate synthase-domain-containing protein [Entophlyctis helioformis]
MSFLVSRVFSRATSTAAARPAAAAVAVASAASQFSTTALHLKSPSDGHPKHSPSQSHEAAAAARRMRRRLPFIPTNISPPSAEEAVNNILYNAPSSAPAPSSRHILSLLCTNESGSLSRIAGIIAGRGFNIESLVVAKTEVPDLSRMTIVVNGGDGQVAQVQRQLEDIVPVWAVLDYTRSLIVEREVLLAKVSTVPHELHLDQSFEEDFETGDRDVDRSPTGSGPHSHSYHATRATGVSPMLSTSMQRQAVSELARLFGGKVVDVSLDAIIIELTAKPARIDAFVELLKPYGILEASRSGTMAMPRSPVSNLHSDADADDADASGSSVDATLLPPG